MEEEEEEEEEERTTEEREMDEGVKAEIDVAQMPPMAAATIAEENFMMLYYAFDR